MEGSWFVTPPPCFTKPNTFDMTSSPLEDMLIEKPVISGSFASDKSFFDHERQHEDEDGFEDHVEDEMPLSPVRSSPILLLAATPLTASLTADEPDLGQEEEQIPESESSNDSQKENEGEEASKYLFDEEEGDAESITTSVSSITDREEDHDEENECMSTPTPVRSRKRTRHQVARPSSLSSGLIMPAASGNLTEVQLNSYRILSRKERKGRKAQKRKNQRCSKKQASDADTASAEDRSEEMFTKRSASSERIFSAIRSLAYEPIRQSKAMQDQSQKIFLKSSFLDRQNHVIHHHHHSNHASSRKIKYAMRPHTFSTNRKTNRNY